jgi:hypothetical protein
MVAQAQARETAEGVKDAGESEGSAVMVGIEQMLDLKGC